MIYRLTIQNGMVQLPDEHGLPDGTEVEVRVPQPKPSNEEEKPILERYARFIGAVTDLPPDMALNHDHYIHGAPKR